MKILIATDTYSPQVNGVVTVLEEQIPKLAKVNEVVVIAPAKINEKMQIKKEGNITTYLIKGHNFPLYKEYIMAPFAKKQVRKIIEEEKPDLVHLHAPVMLGISTLNEAVKKKIPTIITHHTHFPDYIGETVGKSLPQVAKKLFRKVIEKKIKQEYNKANAIIVPSEALKKELEELGILKVEVVENGVDLEKLSKVDQKSIDEFKEKFADNEKVSILLYLGRLSREKKIHILIEAMNEVENAKLLIVGSGPAAKELKEYSQKLKLENKVVFCGFLKNKSVAYTNCDIFVSASDTETFGLTFVEAMWFEKPAIGANKLGATQIIKNNENGVLCIPNSPKDFSKAINGLLNDRETYNKLAKNAKKTAEKYNIENSLDKLIKIYKLQLLN